MPNIRDIARLAQVSHTTVSRFINRNGYVGVKSAEKIQKAMDQLCYRPNKLAHALNAKITGYIAIVVGDLANPVTAKYVKGVEKIASQNGSSLIVCSTGFDPRRESECLVELIEKRVDGIVLAPTGKNSELVHEVIKRKIPLVFITRQIFDFGGDYAGFDDFASSRAVVRHLLERGYRRIAIISRNYEQEEQLGRYAGYVSALHERDLPLNHAWIVRTEADYQSGYMTAKQLLSLPAEHRPDAIYSVVNQQTAGCLAYCFEHGISIPQQVAVAGFESFEGFDALVRPAVTANRLPSKELGESAAKLLFERLYSEQELPWRKIVLKCEFVIRQST